MSDEDLVFCAWDDFLDRDTYVWFWHEADVLLYALGQEVVAKIKTAAEAREVYAKHYDAEDTYVVDPEDVEEEKALILGMFSPKEAEELLEGLVGEYDNFPLNEELDHLPNSWSFWEEATHLDIPGVGYSDDESPASGPIFEVRGADALTALQEAFRGRYRILVQDGVDEYTGSDPEDALRFIERARER